MKKFIIGFLIVIIAIFGAIVIFKLNEDKPFTNKNIIFKNYVVNDTKMVFLDTIVQVGLNKLNYEKIIVYLSPLNSDNIPSISEEINIRAYIVGNFSVYIIYVSSLSRSNAIEVIAHELVHLQQRQTEKLIIDDKRVIWDKKEFDFKSIPYDQYPWEIEAFNEGKILAKEIKNYLYQ